jgi:hypothetical protein
MYVSGGTFFYDLAGNNLPHGVRGVVQNAFVDEQAPPPTANTLCSVYNVPLTSFSFMGVELYNPVIPSPLLLQYVPDQTTPTYTSTGQSCVCCCVHPDTLVKSSRGNQRIRDIVRGDTVYTKDNQPVTVQFNARFSVPTDRFVSIGQNALGTAMPCHDLLIREGHPVVVGSKEIPCQDLVNHTNVCEVQLDKPVHVYTLCTEHRVPVMIEGIEVLTYAKADFIKYAIDNHIPYAPY